MEEETSPNYIKVGCKGSSLHGHVSMMVFSATVFLGSKFYENERKKEEQMKRRIEEQKVKVGKIADEQLQQGLIEVC